VIITDRIPDVGMLKERKPFSADEPQWVVTVSMSGLTSENARRLAAELLNAADDVDHLNEAGR
jgi:hypothetical protein